MKKAITIILALALIMSLAVLAACSTKGSDTTASESPAATSSAPADTSSEPADADTAVDSAAPAYEEGQWTLISGITGSLNDPAGVAMKTMVEEIQEQSNKAILTTGYYDGVMGNDRESIEAIQLGQLTCGGTAGTNMANFVTDVAVFDAPYVFQSEQQMLDLFEDEEFAAYIGDKFEAVGLHLLGVASLGFRTLSSNVEVHGLADLKGLDIRVPESEVPMALWSALGANPTPVSFTEVYTALQQGVVDAQENPVSFIYSMKFYEQQDYIVHTLHQPQFLFSVCNLDWYNELPEDLQAVMNTAGKNWGINATNETQKQLQGMCDEMEAYGCTFITLDDSALADLKEASQPARDLVMEKYPETYAALEAAMARIG